MAFKDKATERAYLKKYREVNKERISALNHSLYLRKKAEIKKYQADYYEAHKLEVLAKNEARRQNKKAQYAEARRNGHRRYYESNREKIAERNKRYNRLHPEIGINHQAKRRAQALTSQIDPAGIKQWTKQVRSLPFVRCYWCGTKVSGNDVHFDHVIPLSKHGSHTIGNLCTSCPNCNLSKCANLPSEWNAKNQIFLSL